MNFAGHGGQPSPETFSIPLFANQLGDFILDNKLQPADIFGYSMGGYVAVYLAKEQPELVGRIITLGTKWKWDADIAEREARMLDPDKIQAKIPAFAEALAKRHAPQDWKVVLQKTAEMMGAMGRDNPLTRADMTSVKNRILVCLADGDTMVTLEETQEAVARLPNGALRTIGSSQHPIEKVELAQLVVEIKNFLSTFAE